MTGTGSFELQPLNSFGVSARAERLITISDRQQLSQLHFRPQRDLILGGGSNLLLAADLQGTVFQVRLAGRELMRESDRSTRVTLGAGENWHAVVRWTLAQGLSGLENLSLIPGLVGAAPIQNIGAYGVELAESLLEVHVWDWQARRQRTLDRDACAFGYRDSRFKSAEPGRFLITALTLRLQHHFTPRLDYAGLAQALQETSKNPQAPSALEVSDAVIRLRREKLPDPAQLGNADSFFKNPVLDAARAEALAAQHPELPLYASQHGRFKVSAAWLIERCGWKGFREGDAGVSAEHALVLVNYGRASGAELAQLAARIRADVWQTFAIELEPEPRILPPLPALA